MDYLLPTTAWEGANEFKITKILSDQGVRSSIRDL